MTGEGRERRQRVSGGSIRLLLRSQLQGMKIKNQKSQIHRVVLAYSGGLDTSVILHWLREEYQADVIAFCADLGQGEDLHAIERKALAVGASKVYVEDLRETFVKHYVFPMLRANAVYEGGVLIGDLHCSPADCPPAG